MFDPATPLVLITFALGAVAGMMGTLLGLGGGVFLVPFLVLVAGIPFHTAIAISLTTVIATSTAVSAAAAGRQLINLRLGIVLEVATAAGGLAGGITAYALSPRTLHLLFAALTATIGAVTLARLNHVDTAASGDTGQLGGSYVDPATGELVTYRVKRLPLALVASVVAGNISTLLGVGGGIVKVPVLNAWCGVPMRAAAATSAFMIGVTATAGAVIYYGRGDMIPELAAAAVLGVQLGSTAGTRVGKRLGQRALSLLLACVLFTVAVLMLVRS
ncbi:MAG TPA: sulfite exporter TauE/SafE family protein [Vicinamibacterales bacterium]|nr:sulfite exporter TauE/SafE family protein [Vicinamibacterales bacterium]